MTKTDREKELARILFSLIKIVKWQNSPADATDYLREKPDPVKKLNDLQEQLAELYMTEPKPKKQKGATPMPEGFGLTDELRAFAKAGGVDDPGMAMGAFKDFHLARGSVFKDWDRAFHTWCRNEVRFGKFGRKR